MTLRLILFTFCLAHPLSLFAGPKEDAMAVFEKFLTALTNANQKEIIELFDHNALFWGTSMQKLGTSKTDILNYFSGLNARKPNAQKAYVIDQPSIVVINTNTVLISGVWLYERITPNKQSPIKLRISLTLFKKKNRWLITQFHNSRLPEL